MTDKPANTLASESHSHGPFTLAPWSPEDGPDKIVRDANGELVALFFGVTGKPDHQPLPAETNARLLLAAQAMKEALGGLYEAQMNGARLERYYDSEIDELWDAAEAALAHADGDQQEPTA